MHAQPFTMDVPQPTLDDLHERFARPHADQRLHNQQLAHTTLDTPSDVVAWLGAVQAQEYALAKWGLALRLRGATNSAVEHALTEGAILRTHVMRPTWHFVTCADIRWLLELTAPRVHAVMRICTASWN